MGAEGREGIKVNSRSAHSTEPQGPAVGAIRDPTFLLLGGKPADKFAASPRAPKEQAGIICMRLCNGRNIIHLPR